MSLQSVKRFVIAYREAIFIAAALALLLQTSNLLVSG